MLVNLKIENVAVIESADIGFERGLTVLTGETGAGKSIIIDSINAILGERTSKELIRTGAQSARVSALFSDISDNVKKKLDEFGVEAEDGMLVVQRNINSDGKNMCRLNGCNVTVSMLRALGANLINIHGQHDSQALLNSDNHCAYLDLLAENGELLEEYRQMYAKQRKLEKQIASLTGDEEDKLRRQEFLRYQIDELSGARLTVGERDELIQARSRWQNSEKIQKLLHTTYEAINGNEDADGASGLLYTAADGLDALKKYYDDLTEPSQSVRDLVYALDDCSSRLSELISSFEYDSVDIDSVEQRLDLIYRLSRKYGETEEDMLAYLDKITAEYESITDSDDMLEKLNAELKKQSKLVLDTAKRLSETRSKAGEEFSSSVMAQLKKLDMPAVVLTVDKQETQPNSNGIDKVQFLISPNPGEAPKPLAKIASGGELSRIMLAVKTVLNGRDKIDTMIFDEIDAGVSGSAAGKIARMLREAASAGGQVICVTHLALIAAYADSHYFIDKVFDESSTHTRVTKLDDDKRKREIARIIGGESITETALNNAAEMLTLAKQDF